MSQHDYVIDNQTFPATRTDLNNALAAIVSQNAGATAPSTTYAYQFWYDTTNDILKMRNSDDDAWIDLFEVDQTNDTADIGGGTSFSLFEYTATSGQTTFTGADDNTATLSYTAGAIIVTMNGIVLDPSDYTATDGTNVVLASGAAANDIINIHAFSAFDVADNVKASTGGTFSGGLVVNGNIDINGNELILDADGDTSITADTDDQIDFKTGGSDRMVIDSSGNVGIGTTSPSEVLDLSATSNPRLRFEDDGDFEYTIGIKDNNAFTISSGGSDDERMRIDSSGNLLVGRTTTTANTEGGYFTQDGLLFVERDNDTALLLNRFGGNGFVAQFRRDNSNVGGISVTTSATSYATSSDYRLKENVTDITGATERLKQLNPVRFNFISDADTTVDGFLAHEVQDVVPEAITGTKDAMRDEQYEITPAVEATYDDEGNVLTEAVPAVMGTRSVPDYQGIDQSKLVPLLVATIQELEARVAALEIA